MSLRRFRRLVFLALGAGCALSAPARLRGEESPRKDAAAGVEWVSIPGGEFTMGNTWDADSKPHRVAIKSFQMAKTLVTFKQYGACVTAGACTPAHVADGTCTVYTESMHHALGGLATAFQGADQPVVCVDWEQARIFSAWAGGRLPSEAEWEYAARGEGRNQEYPWGDQAATCDRAVISEGAEGCGRHATWPVCSRPKGNTAQGLCDMAGDAWEWTRDWYHDSYAGAPADGGAWESPEGTRRVARGGSWYRDASYARAALRYSFRPELRYGYIGFRPVR